jgi:hypothetical protein
MARSRPLLRNAITGELEPQSESRNIFYDALHDTGSFDPRMTDPDFLTGKQAIPKRRVVAPLTLWPDTVESLDRLSRAMGMSRGRVVDKLVSQAVALLEKWEKKNGEPVE